MAPIVLVMILLGIAAQTESATLGLNRDEAVYKPRSTSFIDDQRRITILTQVCSEGRAYYPSSAVQLLDLICSSFTWEGSGEGSGEGSRNVPEEHSTGGKWIYYFEPIAALIYHGQDDDYFRQYLCELAEGACQAAEKTGFEDSDVKSFCLSNRLNIDTDDGGSGEIITGSDEDNDDDDYDDDNDEGHDDHDDISIGWSSDYDGLQNDPFYFTNHAT